ncbi:MAG: hypothetical protein A2583_12195 [Bdellovibrionales bacterium RIFOXYD1_FULL_53_11]|nr:MAG: hypothetical protein A2583_12195 [Bdellovibrionales bacterium RIFOXYD1_FULL_53_11]
MDTESLKIHSRLESAQQIRAARVPGVRTALVVLSSRYMANDLGSLRQSISAAYPETAVFFFSTSGAPLGVSPPQRVDLVIDFTGPGQRQSFLLPVRLRRMARFAAGRAAGFFRRKFYDRIFDEKTAQGVPSELLELEAYVQTRVLAIAGIPVAQSGDPTT